jgi:hypothetical protein
VADRLMSPPRALMLLVVSAEVLVMAVYEPPALPVKDPSRLSCTTVTLPAVLEAVMLVVLATVLKAPPLTSTLPCAAKDTVLPDMVPLLFTVTLPSGELKLSDVLAAIEPELTMPMFGPEAITAMPVTVELSVPKLFSVPVCTFSACPVITPPGDTVMALAEVV